MIACETNPTHTLHAHDEYALSPAINLVTEKRIGAAICRQLSAATE